MQERLLLPQGFPSTQVQAWPEGQPVHAVGSQVDGSPPLLPPIVPPLPVPHWQFVMSQVWPEAQMLLQLAGHTQELLAPHVAGAPQGGLQLAVTHALFWQTCPTRQPCDRQPAPPSPAWVHDPLMQL